MRSTLPLAFGLTIPLLAAAAGQAAGAQPRVPQAVAPSALVPSAPAPTMPDAPDPPPVILPVPSPVTAAPAADSPSAPAPLMPLDPPAPPVIPPPLAVPTRPAAPPPVVVVVADAQGTAAKTDEGWRITFGPGKSDLNPATVQALRDLARALPAQASVIVSAFAPGTPEDPSSSRRLSLARGLAARGVLITEGLVSTRITVRALGASPAIAAGPADRVDLVFSSPAAPTRPAP